MSETPDGLLAAVREAVAAEAEPVASGGRGAS